MRFVQGFGSFCTVILLLGLLAVAPTHAQDGKPKADPGDQWVERLNEEMKRHVAEARREKERAAEKAFYQYTPTTKAGQDFFSRLTMENTKQANALRLRVGRLLNVAAAVSSPKKVLREEITDAKTKQAYECVELWAVKFGSMIETPENAARAEYNLRTLLETHVGATYQLLSLDPKDLPSEPEQLLSGQRVMKLIGSP